MDAAPLSQGRDVSHGALLVSDDTVGRERSATLLLGTSQSLVSHSISTDCGVGKGREMWLFSYGSCLE